MLKIPLAVYMLLVATPLVAADPLGFQDQVKAILIDHVGVVGQMTDGENKVAMVDSVIQFGSVNGYSVFDIQAGFAGNVKPDGSEEGGVNWLTGGFFKVSSLIRSKVNYPDHWKFLRAIEHGVKYEYDWTAKRDYVCYQFGLAFTLKPKE